MELQELGNGEVKGLDKFCKHLVALLSNSMKNIIEPCHNYIHGEKLIDIQKVAYVMTTLDWVDLPDQGEAVCWNPLFLELLLENAL
jgi:hypothetical protein